ncbi:MAG TPA: hypothetical protein VM843_03535 [Flavisolibacter sp.]|jgi:hypothetical protein|nr:hypothetical protein [Flavisolibacter sp.]
MEPHKGGEINKLDNRGHGPQGIDKAPGEETPQDDVQFIQQSQKGKKVDADLSNEEERPIEQDENL